MRVKNPDWISLEDFVDQQVARAIAELDAFIAEHEGEEREAMLRQRSATAAKLEGMVRLAYAEYGQQRQ
jgi:hypothetical protein